VALCGPQVMDRMVQLPSVLHPLPMSPPSDVYPSIHSSRAKAFVNVDANVCQTRTQDSHSSALPDLLRSPSPGHSGSVAYERTWSGALLQWGMSVYEDHRDELEKHEFSMGTERGRLAVTLDLLTDALVLVGQHGVYCQSTRQPGRPALDIQVVSRNLEHAKELVSSVMQSLRRDAASDRRLG